MKVFDPKDWTVDQKKPSKELRSFDGDMAVYDSWRRRVRDHFVGVNCNYGLIFDKIEQTKVPINWSSLATTYFPHLPRMNWEWASTHIWTFIGGYLGDDMMRRRLTLTNGQDYNGLELWRALFAENNGGSTELAVLERGWFIDFPKCDKPSDLQPHMSAWIQLKNKYGPGDYRSITWYQCFGKCSPTLSRRMSRNKRIVLGISISRSLMSCRH